jgi:Uma2 family endonuclease
MVGAVEQVGQIHQRLFTVEEYRRMADAGILRPDERVELIHGVVRTMSPKNRAHVVATTKLYQRLVKFLAGRSAVFKEDPLKLVELKSEPEPDIVAASSPYLEVYDTAGFEPLLVIEVAESSLRFDLNAKAGLYAEAGVPEYWVVNLVDRELVVFWSPFEGTYRQRSIYCNGDRVVPRAWSDVSIDVSELFLAD